MENYLPTFTIMPRFGHGGLNKKNRGASNRTKTWGAKMVTD